MSNNKDSIFKSKSDAGKGDKPRSISKKYYDNYDQINWHKRKNDNENKN
jgi:hypothetical protein